MPDNKLTDKEIKEAKSLRWLANQFPKVENPKDNGDRLCNCINLYCTNAAELIERQAAEIKNLTNDVAISRKETKEYKAGYKVACSERNEFLEQLETAEIKAYKECIEKVSKIITEFYNKHVFGSNDLTDEEKDAIINFSDDITDKLRKLKEEMAGE